MKVLNRFNISFQYYCCLCGKRSVNALCTLCETYLPRATSFCFNCGTHLENTENLNVLCGQCIKNPPPYQRTISCFWYEEPLQTLIQDYKFHEKLFLTPVLGTLMFNAVQQYYQQHQLPYPKVIIPMPIHPKRLKERGYHQVHELAKVIAKKLSIPISLKSCRRICHTPPQSALPFNERKKNVQNAFSAQKINQPHIAIIDDVMTTGETLSALSQAFLNQNPSIQIDIWCLARTKMKYR